VEKEHFSKFWYVCQFGTFFLSFIANLVKIGHDGQNKTTHENHKTTKQVLQKV